MALVVGSSPLLGDWSAQDGLQLTWTEGDVWTAEVPISAGFYEFKCVVYNEETNSVARWEDGGNRILNIPQELGTWDVSCAWGATADMTQAFTPVPPPPPPPPAPAEPAIEEAPAAAEPADAAADESLPTFMALTDEAERASSNTDSASDQPSDATVAVGADASGAAALEATGAASGGGAAGGVVAFFLATCAAGAVAAAAVLSPGGLDPSLLGGVGRAGELLNSTVLQSTVAGAQVRAQLQTQLSALAGHVNAVQAQVAAVTPAVAAQVASVGDTMVDGLASLQPVVASAQRSGAAVVQSQASAITAAATAATAAASDVMDSVLSGRQG
ncbi:hypothetical protein GPECTOR_12g404 [Gonium pectorale]|uniref:CBM20 domain-containing protein n=1 Tax=Gonium pectorale TaxID=33097 RepID=A0A150GNR5_GONPE|nr:hypothetical protein GPECTOR_12g404 [Gonium pectorale]|eukprot:KXZ51441.1 hypothetical protein GPECTOR_12g404 [Gonium pectorale]